MFFFHLVYQFNVDQGHSSPGNLLGFTASAIGDATKAYWILRVCTDMVLIWLNNA